MPGIHGVCDGTGRPAITDASQGAYAGTCNSIGVRVQLLKKTIISGSDTDDKQRATVDGADTAARIDADQFRSAIAESGKVMFKHSGDTEIDHPLTDIG